MSEQLTFAARMLLNKERASKAYNRSKAFYELKPKLITEDMDEKTKLRKQKDLDRKQKMRYLLVEKGIRIPDDIDPASFDASDFASKLLQKNTIAHLVPYLEEPVPQATPPKAAVEVSYRDGYAARIRDFQKFFERKINYTKQTLLQYRQRQMALERKLIETKKLLKLANEEEKFDNHLDQQRFEVRRRLEPRLIFVTQNAYRVTDMEQALRTVAQAYPFFTRHYPIQAVCEMVNGGAYENCRFMLATASRLLRLLQLGFVDAAGLKHFVVDCSYRDDKGQTPFEYDLARADLRVVAGMLPDGVKVWVL